MLNVVVVGAAGFGRECLDVLEAMKADGSDVRVLGVLDDGPTEANLRRLEQREIDFLGTTDTWIKKSHTDVRFIIGIGNPRIRRLLVSRFEAAGFYSMRAIHPSATLGSEVRIGEGSVICSQAVLSTNVLLGNHVHVNPRVTIGHDSVLESFVSINPAAVISGEVQIGNGVLVGANSTVLQNLQLGDSSLIGAGAVVTRNIPSGAVAKGIPARW